MIALQLDFVISALRGGLWWFTTETLLAAGLQKIAGSTSGGWWGTYRGAKLKDDTSRLRLRYTLY